MNAEIIAVGSELLLGQIANTNAQFISEQLAALGVDVFFHTVCGDNEARMIDVIKNAENRADLLIFTGGLGPTKDDLTKETVARVLGRKLVTDQAAMDSIVHYFQVTGREMTENNKKQALVIDGSHVLPNRHGMAPGMIVDTKKHIYLLMPGVPSEMKPMFLDFVRGWLSTHSEKHIQSRVLRFFGIGESQLETKILDLIDAQSNPTIAPLAKESEVTLRLTAKHAQKDAAEAMLDQIEAKIATRVGAFLYGYDDDSLSQIVFQLMRNQKKTIAFAESLTGGMAADWLAAYPGASSVLNGGVVCYTNQVKNQVLHVPESILNTEGAVSAACAEKMASSVRTLCGADLGLSFTGVAGPDKSEGKPVGTVYIGLSDQGGTQSYRFQFNGSRRKIRIQSTKTGYDLVRRHLQKLPILNH
ncbi:competence/damage-inducible protein A [Sporolactobacillus inulinus]|uniref:Putative competence-damage inducible protein n=1 Tax=Sporolactobacillus inulinus CASD TaxID=1069536 RepID=A0A0U1QMC2_9BACL|nr:competence/damage-inducible protein A [Sporolactobacillus inulinus]KLI01974.1 damage-inducible protein CinA [Sporolactobacillus inulinus CASD]GEB75957.1 putative competence-damage inducible protein [Sporolactobacillus inulinus]